MAITVAFWPITSRVSAISKEQIVLIKQNLKGALRGFGEAIIIERERSSLTDMFYAYTN